MKDFKKWGGKDPSNGADELWNGGGVGAWYPFTPLCWHLNKASLFVKYDAENSGLLFLYL